jgi:hypothetical protein
MVERAADPHTEPPLTRTASRRPQAGTEKLGSLAWLAAVC